MSNNLLLFSYGTLRQREVQLAVFGRELHESPDVLTGFEVGTVQIENPDVVETSGAEVHPILHRSADPAARVMGAVLTITADDLLGADAYETKAYARTLVTLETGRTAFVYLAAGEV